MRNILNILKIKIYIYKVHYEISKNEKILNSRVSDKEAEEAFIKIFQWIGEDPSREGLLETPKRVVRAFKEYFKGYNEDPKKVLEKTFRR